MRMYVMSIVRAMHDCDQETQLVVFENPHVSVSELNALSRVRTQICPLVPRNRVGRVLYQNTIYPALMRSVDMHALLATCNVLPFATPVPAVVVVQSVQFYERASSYSTWRRAYLRSTVARSVRRAEAVICLSEASKSELVNLIDIGEEKVFVVYHGLPATSDRGNDAGPSESGLPPYILYVSHLAAYKNIFRLLEAYSRLRQEHHIIHRLRVIGPETEFTVLDVQRKAVELGVGGFVDVVGPVSQDQLRHQYEYADLFVYPSLHETFGLPPLEAMAAGCPVVAANASSIPEIVGDAAELVDPLDVDSIAHGMSLVLFDIQRRKHLIERGRSRIQEFTWERAGQRTLDILKKVAGR